MERNCNFTGTQEQWDALVEQNKKDNSQMKVQQIDNLTFGGAIEALKQGRKVAREGWNGKGMWLQLQGKRTLGIPLDGDRIGNMLPYIAMKVVGCSEWGEDSINLVPWLASQTDMLAEDWQLVE